MIEKLKFNCFIEIIFCFIIYKFEYLSDILKKLLCKFIGIYFFCIIFFVFYRLYMCNKDIIGLYWVWVSDFLVDVDYCF